MPPPALHVERFTPESVPLAHDVLVGIGQQAAGRHLQVVESEYAVVQAVGSVIPELTPTQLMVMTLVAHGRSRNQIRKKDPSLSVGDIVGVQKDLEATFKVRTTSAVVHQMIVRNILPIELEADEQRTSQLTHMDRSTLRSYAAGKVPKKIAKNLGMTVAEFIEYEKGLHRKISSWTRPQSVFQGHRFGVLRKLGLAEVNSH